jgi:hypothetical protein
MEQPLFDTTAMTRMMARQFLTRLEEDVQWNFRTKALAQVTNRNTCIALRKEVEKVITHPSWETLPWYQRVLDRIRMSLLSRRSTFHKSFLMAERLSATKKSMVWINVRELMTGIEGIAYREQALKFCEDIRHYFRGREHRLDVQFWTLLSDLEQTAYELKGVSPRLYRDSFVLRFRRLNEVALTQLTDTDALLEKVGSNKS